MRLMTAMNLKSSPSLAVTQITWGIGNIAPSRLPGAEPRFDSIHTYTQENAIKHTKRHMHKYTQHSTYDIYPTQ